MEHESEQDLEEAEPKADHNEQNLVVAVCTGAAISGSIPLVAVGTIQGIGFSSAGITAGSVAAGMMSAEAIIAGGGIASGGTVATLQSIGAIGFAASAPIGGTVLILSSVVVGLGYGIFKCLETFTTSPRLSEKPVVSEFPFRKIAIRAIGGNDKFLIALGGGFGNWFYDLLKDSIYTGVVKAQSNHVGEWEMFTVHPCNGDGCYFALQSHHGAFLCIHDGGGGHDSIANRFQIGNWEKFQFERDESKEDVTNGLWRGYFQSWDGSYMTTKHIHSHFTSNCKIHNKNEAELFEIHPR